MSSTITKFFASFLAYGVANKKKRFSAIGRFSEGLAPVKGKSNGDTSIKDMTLSFL